MFNCFKSKKQREKERIEKTKKLSRKLSEIVIMGLNKLDEEGKKEVAKKRWSKINKQLLAVKSFKKI
tara:strand:- start:1132 stop:1332 length:201 start_codon:yes stop_codon:yes gene_type:complete